MHTVTILLLVFLRMLLSTEAFHPRIKSISGVGAFINRRCLVFPLTAKVGPKSSSAGSDKIRVRFLQDVKGQGKKSEIVFVSAALYQNVLSVQKLAERMSDDQFNTETKQREQREKDERAQLSVLAGRISALQGVLIRKKIGENGKIFGALTRKGLLEHLKSQFHDEISWPTKMSILDIKNAITGEMISGEGDDVRQAGKYICRINLGNPNVDQAMFTFDIISDKPL